MKGMVGRLLPLTLVASLAFAPPAPAQDTYQGFGAATPGGAGGSVVHVTTLGDAGPGSLREAVAGGNRTVVFDVAGDIVLASPIHVTGAFVTIDGSSAPAPGITLRNHGLFIHGDRGAHDVIVHGLRVRNAATDGLHVKNAAYNVVIDHCSVHGSGDGNLDITQASHDVTVSWSILAEPAGSQKNSLIKYGPSRVTLHHNLFVGARKRNPLVQIDNVGTPAADTTLDMRNNVVWEWGDPDLAFFNYGTMIGWGARANVVANFYAAPSASAADQGRALTVCEGDCYAGDVARIAQLPSEPDPASAGAAHVAGNVSGDSVSVDLNAEGNQSDPFDAPAVDTQAACAAAALVLADAGVRPLDAVDQAYVSPISIAGCSPDAADLGVVALTGPAFTGPGTSVDVSDTVQNLGSQAAGAFTVTYALSADALLDGGDVVLGSRLVSGLGPGETSAAVTALPLAPGLPSGVYHILVSADADDAVPEPVDTNNTRSASLTVGWNLVASALSAASSAGPGTAITVTDTVTNAAAPSPAPTTVSFFLSADAALDAGDVLLGSRTVPALAVGGASAGTTSLTVPGTTAGGAYHLVAHVDPANLVEEASEADNVRTRPLTVAVTADLTVNAVSAPGRAARGTVVSVGDTVKNTGQGMAPASTLTLRLSTNQTYDDADVELATREVPPLGARASDSAVTPVTIPAGTPPGNYYVVARVAPASGGQEVNAGNNTRASRRIKVQ